VYMLRQRRDQGWAPPPPTPRADAPEALGAYFTQRAAEQAAGQGAAQAHEQSPVEPSPERFSALAQAPPLPKALQPPSLSELWQDVLATLRLRLPREVYQTCVRQATLMGYADGIATIGVAGARLKDTLGHQNASSLRLALRDVLGRAVALHVVIRMLA
jgi:hypothetical protein